MKDFVALPKCVSDLPNVLRKGECEKLLVKADTSIFLRISNEVFYVSFNLKSEYQMNTNLFAQQIQEH